MTTARRADPGIGQDNAPVGSRAWAERVRLDMQAVVGHVHEQPESLRFYVDLVKQHRAWTLMNKPDGSCFATFEDFCAHKRPWGLGKPWETIEPFLVAVIGKPATQLMTVAPAQSPPGKVVDDNRPEGGLLPERHTERLRAIAERAPEPVRALFRDDLIGTKEAAALGPKNPTPEEAARVTAVAIEAAKVAEASPTKTPKEKRETKQKVNATVRKALDREADPVRLATLAIAKVPFQRLAELACYIPLETRRALLACLKGTM